MRLLHRFCIFLGLFLWLGSPCALAATFSDAQLRQYQQADAALQTVRQRYLPVLAKAEKNGNNDHWAKAAMQIDMAKAIRAAGLALDEYNRIAHAVATQHALRQRLTELSTTQTP